MQEERTRALATARLVVLLIYVVCLIVFPPLGRLLGSQARMPPDGLRLLSLVLTVVAVAEYGSSLFLEQNLLSGRSSAAGSPSPAAAAIIVASLGASIAIYGFVLALLGAARWSMFFYALALLHGLHLGLRWYRYERAAREGP